MLNIDQLQIIGTSTPIASSTGFTFEYLIDSPFLHFLMVIFIIALCWVVFYFAAKSIWD